MQLNKTIIINKDIFHNLIYNENTICVFVIRLKSVKIINLLYRIEIFFV